MTKERVWLHSIDRYLVAVYLIWMGGAVTRSRVESGAASQFGRLGLTPEAVGYGMVMAGLLLLFTRGLRLQLLLTLCHIPLTIAALLLLYHTHVWQSIAVYAFVQMAMPRLIMAAYLEKKRSEQ